MKTLRSVLSTVIQPGKDWKNKLLREWPTIVGDLHEHMSLERIEGTTLFLAVRDSCWMQELFLLSSMIISSINAKLDRPEVTAVRFVLRTDKKRVVLLQKNAPLYVQRNVTLQEHHRRALSLIKDEGLAHALEIFLVRCLQ